MQVVRLYTGMGRLANIAVSADTRGVVEMLWIYGQTAENSSVGGVLRCKIYVGTYYQR